MNFGNVVSDNGNDISNVVAYDASNVAVDESNRDVAVDAKALITMCTRNERSMDIQVT